MKKKSQNDSTEIRMQINEKNRIKDFKSAQRNNKKKSLKRALCLWSRGEFVRARFPNDEQRIKS